MGSPEHMAMVFHRCSLSAVFAKKGPRVKLGRRASWLNANRAWKGEQMPALLVLTYMGVLRGWWKSVDEGVPVGSSTMQFLLEEEELVVAEPAGAEQAASATGAAASQGHPRLVQAVRAQACTSNQHFGSHG